MLGRDGPSVEGRHTYSALSKFPLTTFDHTRTIQSRETLLYCIEQLHSLSRLLQFSRLTRSTQQSPIAGNVIGMNVVRVEVVLLHQLHLNRARDLVRILRGL